ncbi:MAG TPA: LysE family translocator [Oceanospirillales bacterium]|nr:LysE family translocator [Oceanospirillales bacterium]
MLSVSEVFSFILASGILAFTPGPDIIFVIVTSLSQDFKTALKFILGLATGIMLHTFLVVVGISTLISQSQYGLIILKYFAVIYLLYLAYLTFIHRHDSLNLQEKTNSHNYYLRGFIMNVSNPKVLLFFLAFFPQFANLNQTGYQFRLLILGFLFILVTLVVFSSVAWIAAKGGSKILAKPSYSLIINYLTIFVFITVSVLLLWF